MLRMSYSGQNFRGATDCLFAVSTGIFLYYQKLFGIRRTRLN